MAADKDKEKEEHELNRLNHGRCLDEIIADPSLIGLSGVELLAREELVSYTKENGKTAFCAPDMVFIKERVVYVVEYKNGHNGNDMVTQLQNARRAYQQKNHNQVVALGVNKADGKYEVVRRI